MPIYEFFSPERNRIYSFYSHSVIDASVIPRCPDGPDASMTRMISGFAVVGRAREPGVPDPSEVEDARMEAALAEMDREMAALDEEHPDPRQMGKLMRRMSELTGEKMPEQMAEMVGRLEAGEDPDALEAEFGDLAEVEGFADGREGELGKDPPGHKRQRRQRELKRDPQLYELRDYI